MEIYQVIFLYQFKGVGFITLIKIMKEKDLNSHEDVQTHFKEKISNDLQERFNETNSLTVFFQEKLVSKEHAQDAKDNKQLKGNTEVTASQLEPIRELYHKDVEKSLSPTYSDILSWCFLCHHQFVHCLDVSSSHHDFLKSWPN